MTTSRCILLLWAAVASAAASAQPASYEDCDVLVRARPDALASYRCFWALSRQTGDRAGALAALENRLTQSGDPRLLLMLGAVLVDDGQRRAVAAYEAAAKDCVGRGFWDCAAAARVGLSELAWTGRSTEAIRADLEAAAEAAAATEDPWWALRVLIARGYFSLGQEELGAARSFFELAESTAFPAGSYDQQTAVLGGLGAIAWSAGRLEEARAHWRRQLELDRAHGDRRRESGTLSNVVLAEINLIGRERMSEVRQLIDEALLVARSISDRLTEVKLLTLRAQTFDDGPGRLAAWQDVVDLARLIGARAAEEEIRALRYLAIEGHAAGGPLELAEALLAEARRLAIAMGSSDSEIRTCFVAAELEWMVGQHDAASRRVDDCIDRIDELRARQPLSQDRALTVAAFSSAVNSVADAALSVADDFAAAFGWLERSRARSLAEDLALSTAEEPLPELLALREQIEGLQRQFGSASPDEAASLLAELRASEAREAEILRQVRPEVGLPSIPRLADVQGLLAEDELILVFSIGDPARFGWQSTGAWVLALGRRRLEAYPLPSKTDLEAAIGAFRGLLDRDDDRSRRAAVRVYELLLAEPLADTGPLRHLIVVPDVPLHDLPFGTLRSAPDSPPLVARVTIERVPSVALWSQWRRDEIELVGGDVLAVSAPPLGRSESQVREAGLTRVGELGPLPHARREAERVARLFGPRALLLDGERATETSVLEAFGRRVSLAHFATHAVVDSARPQRSAVVLAADDDNDGLLQPRDIAGLSIAGSLVVLSACRSAGGDVVPGEGVFGLARAFLAAGAGAVIGNLAPVGDRAAAELMTGFYRELGRGRSVSEALASVQLRLAERGRPPAEWSQTVLIGNGRLRLEPEPSHRTAWLLMTSFLVLVGMALVLRQSGDRVVPVTGQSR